MSAMKRLKTTLPDLLGQALVQNEIIPVTEQRAEIQRL